MPRIKGVGALRSSSGTAKAPVSSMRFLAAVQASVAAFDLGAHAK